MNALASVIRGTGNMLVPALVTCGGVVLLVAAVALPDLRPRPVSGAGRGGRAARRWCCSMPAAWPCWGAGTCWAGRATVRLRIAKLRRAMFREILGVGAVAALTSVQTNLTVALTTAMVGASAGSDAVAGIRHGGAAGIPADPAGVRAGRTAGRAGGHEYRRRASAPGAAHHLDRRRDGVALTEAIGLAASAWPDAWLGLFGSDPRMLATVRRICAWSGRSTGFRAGHGAVFCVPGRGAAAVAAPGRAAAAADRGRRRLGGAAADRVADGIVRGPGHRAGAVRRHAGGGGPGGGCGSGGRGRGAGAQFVPVRAGAKASRMRHSAIVPCRHCPISDSSSRRKAFRSASLRFTSARCARGDHVDRRARLVPLIGQVEQDPDLLDGKAQLPGAPP